MAVEDQLCEERGADSVADAIRAHINGIFDGKTISIPGTKLRCIAKAYDISLEFRDQVGQIEIQNGLPPSPHFRLIRSNGFECRGGCLHEVAVDGRDMGDVCCC